MRKFILLAVVLICLVVGSPAPATAEPITVKATVEPTHVPVVLGDRFTIETTLTNTAASSTGDLLVHLNVASLDSSVYVDPEDWSSERSQQLLLQPGESRTLSWDLQAVNPGSFAVYVVVLPYGDAAARNQELVVGPLARINVAARSMLSAGGALPVVLLIPLLLGVAAAGARLRLRRRS
jgi:hypothetical protein